MTEIAVENYGTTTRGAASLAAYRAVRILQVLSDHTGEDKALLPDELAEHLAHPDNPAQMPISAARRSIYTAISALRHAGYEIEYKRGVGYRLLTRPLTDEEIVRLHGMVMRNRSTPIAIRKRMAKHLVDMASVDVRGYLNAPEPAPVISGAPAKGTKPPVTRIDACELIEQAIDQGTSVSFDLLGSGPHGTDEAVRVTIQPFAIRQRDGISYLLGTRPRRPGHRRYPAHRRGQPYEKRLHASARRQETVRRPGRGGAARARRLSLAVTRRIPRRPSGSVLKNPTDC